MLGPFLAGVLSNQWVFTSPSPFHVCVYACACMCVRSVAQSHQTLCNTMDCSPPGSSVHGILQARILEWVAMPSSRGSSRSRDWSHIFLHWQADSLPLHQLGSTHLNDPHAVHDSWQYLCPLPMPYNCLTVTGGVESQQTLTFFQVSMRHEN